MRSGAQKPLQSAQAPRNPCHALGRSEASAGRSGAQKILQSAQTLRCLCRTPRHSEARAMRPGAQKPQKLL
eukprot:7089319-Pyramimonas_sp.AAC.1